jgi:hypothetical protein
MSILFWRHGWLAIAFIPAPALSAVDSNKVVFSLEGTFNSTFTPFQSCFGNPDGYRAIIQQHDAAICSRRPDPGRAAAGIPS